MITQLLIVFSIPILISLLITPWVIRYATRIGAMDQPNERKIHHRPIPRLGGLVIYVSFFVSLGVLQTLSPESFSVISLAPTKGVMLTIALVLVLGLGIFDDLRPRTPTQKLIVQLVAGTLAYSAGFRFGAVTDPLGRGLLDLGMFDYPATLLWIVGITNAFNLIDGLDGLAGGVAVIASFTIFGIALLKNDMSTAIMALIMAGAVVGFLRYNFNPARIFLGDSGSLFLGFALSVFSLQSSTKGSTALAILVPILSLGLPIMDTLLSMLRRLLGSVLPEKARSKPFLRRFSLMFLPDSGHIHHRLMARGFSHRTAVLFLYLVSCVFGIGAFAITVASGVGASLIVIAVIVATAIGVRQLHYKEMAVLRNGLLLPIYDWHMMNRRFFQGFLDLAFILIAYTSAFLVVYHGSPPAEMQQKLLVTLALVGGIKLIVFYLSGQYKGTFRHLGIGDVLRTVKTVVLSELIAGGVLALLPDPWRVRNVPLLLFDFYFLLSLAGGIRISFHILTYFFRREHNGGKRVLIYGADGPGDLTLQHILSDQTLNMSPVGFLDDSPQLEGKRLDGYPIYGGHWVLPRILKTMRIDQILIADSTVKPEVLRRLKDTARIHNIPVLQLRMKLEDVSSVTRQPQPARSFEIPEEQRHPASEAAQVIE
jgi:UDP-GlcNAc:undecaprenyl-phosphate GlcNAc-1-phosphate transferase